MWGQNNKEKNGVTKGNQKPPRHPSSSGSANSLVRTVVRVPRVLLRLRSLRGFSRSFAWGRNANAAAASGAPSRTMDIGGGWYWYWPICGKWEGCGGVLLISDSSDSEEDRSGTSDGMRPVGSGTAAGVV